MHRLDYITLCVYNVSGNKNFVGKVFTDCANFGCWTMAFDLKWSRECIVPNTIYPLRASVITMELIPLILQSLTNVSSVILSAIFRYSVISILL